MLDYKFCDEFQVLILLPMASIAYRVINRLIHLTPSGHRVSVNLYNVDIFLKSYEKILTFGWVPLPQVNVEHIGRFCDEFGHGKSDDQEDEDEDGKKSKSWKTSKPSDFQTLFGGNNNDHFMIGIKFTK